MDTQLLINSKLLKAQMLLQDITVKAIARNLKWSEATAYRKINGEVACTAPEIQKLVDLLNLNIEAANRIFFNKFVSQKTNSDAAERLLVRGLAAQVSEFYKDPTNQKAFEFWLEDKEEK